MNVAEQPMRRARELGVRFEGKLCERFVFETAGVEGPAPGFEAAVVLSRTPSAHLSPTSGQ